MFDALRDADHIYTKTIQQAFDEQEKMFLPDRFVRGTCPRCKSDDQYGDACEVCGATYNPNDLIDPVSVLSGTKPVWKESEHYFFRLSAFEERLRKWIDSAGLHQNVTSKLEEWFAAGLQDWDISRDAPYFGFLIPGTDDKYFSTRLTLSPAGDAITLDFAKALVTKAPSFFENQNALPAWPAIDTAPRSLTDTPKIFLITHYTQPF